MDLYKDLLITAYLFLLSGHHFLTRFGLAEDNFEQIFVEYFWLGNFTFLQLKAFKWLESSCRAFFGHLNFRKGFRRQLIWPPHCIVSELGLWLDQQLTLWTWLFRYRHFLFHRNDPFTRDLWLSDIESFVIGMQTRLALLFLQLLFDLRVFLIDD